MPGTLTAVVPSGRVKTLAQGVATAVPAPPVPTVAKGAVTVVCCSSLRVAWAAGRAVGWGAGELGRAGAAGAGLRREVRAGRRAGDLQGWAGGLSGPLSAAPLCWPAQRRVMIWAHLGVCQRGERHEGHEGQQETPGA